MKSARIGWGSIYPNHVQDCKKAHLDDIGSRTDHIVHICAGSGSVPNFSILKHALDIRPDLRHTFLYSNKTWDDIIYHRDLAALETEHRDLLRVIHTLTREADASRYGPSVFRRRMDTAFLRNWIPDPSACVVYACGPAMSPWDRASAKRPHVRQFATPPGVVMSRPVSVAAGEDTGGRFTALARVLLYILSPPYGGGAPNSTTLYKGDDPCDANGAGGLWSSSAAGIPSMIRDGFFSTRGDASVAATWLTRSS